MKITWENPRVEPRETFGDLSVGDLFTLPGVCAAIYIKTQDRGALLFDRRGDVTFLSAGTPVEPLEAVEIKVRRVR